MKTIYTILLLLVTLAPSLFAAGELIEIEMNSTKEKGINLVIVAEGYTSSEREKFITHTGAFIQAIFSDPSLAQYRKYHNVYGAFIASNQSGADVPLDNITRDTYFDGYYRDIGTVTRPDDRLVTVNQQKVQNFVNTLLPEQDLICVSVNYNKYGGSGGNIAVSSYSSPEIVAHEIGHSFVGLADEYSTFYSAITPSEGINVTAYTSKSQIRWNSWFEDGIQLPTTSSYPNYQNVIGLFEGANYRPTGWYRPKHQCRMRVNGADLCSVCSEAWILEIYDRVSPLDSASHSNGETVVLNGANPIEVFTKQTTANSVIVEWYVDGVKIQNNSTSLSALPESGVFTVKAVVRDTSVLVRNDPSALLTDTLTWQVSNDGSVEFNTLTVVNGTGSGEIQKNAAVTITAEDSTGFSFEAWIGNIENLSDPSAKSTTLIMPDSNITVTATYKESDLKQIDQSDISVISISSSWGEAYDSTEILDNRDETFWNSANTSSQFVTFMLHSEYTINGFGYLPRQDNDAGSVNEFTIEISQDGTNWSEAATGALPDSKTRSIVEIPETEKVSYVRFVMNSSHREYYSMANFELYYGEKGIATSLFTQNRVESAPQMVAHQGQISCTGFGEGIGKISAYSLNGRRLMSKQVEFSAGVAKLDMSSFRNGVVILKIENGTKQLVKKMLL